LEPATNPLKLTPLTEDDVPRFDIKKTLYCLLAAAWMVVSVGCASMTHLTKEKPLQAPNQGSLTFIDAKQRAVANVRVGNAVRLCAEPSPDALSALAASSGVELSKAEVLQVAANGSLAEGAASIGLRTQSIQLMRDAMYRLCEGYLSGAIDGVAFETLQRRFQSSMVAILAIEQLTGAVRAPAVTLGGSATAGAAELAASLTEKSQAAREAWRAAEADVAAKQDALKKATAAREALESEDATLKKIAMPTDKDKARMTELVGLIAKAKSAETAAETAAGDAAKTSTEKEAAYKALDAARREVLAGGGSAAVTAVAAASAAKATDIAGVAAAVQGIVENTLNLEFGRELCATVLTKEPAAQPGPTFTTCVSYLAETVQALKGRQSAVATLAPEVGRLLQSISALIRDPNADANKVKAATEALAAAQNLLGSGAASVPMMLTPP
jgi:hypothetical protein